MDSTNPLDSFLTTQQVAKLLQLHPSTLSKWRSKNRSPFPFIIVGGSVRYPLQPVKSFTATFIEGGSK